MGIVPGDCAKIPFLLRFDRTFMQTNCCRLIGWFKHHGRRAKIWSGSKTSWTNFPVLWLFSIKPKPAFYTRDKGLKQIHAALRQLRNEWFTGEWLEPRTYFMSQKNERWGFWFGVIWRVRIRHPSRVPHRKSSLRVQLDRKPPVSAQRVFLIAQSLLTVVKLIAGLFPLAGEKPSSGK